MIPEEKIHVVNYGVDHSFYYPREKNAENCSVLYIGEVSRSKGVDSLIRAFHLVKQEVAEANLIIGGTYSKDQSFFKKICQDLGISHVRVVSAMESEVQTVFCASGSGMGYLGDALNYKAGVLVTGDVRYHAALEALELGIAVIDAGHYGMEKTAVSLLLKSFQTEFERQHLKISCIACNVEDDPFVEIYTERGGFPGERRNTTSRRASGDR